MNDLMALFDWAIVKIEIAAVFLEAHPMTESFLGICGTVLIMTEILKRNYVSNTNKITVKCRFCEEGVIRISRGKVIQTISFIFGVITAYYLWEFKTRLPWYVVGILAAALMSECHTLTIATIRWKFPVLAAYLTGDRRIKNQGPPKGKDDLRKR